MEGHDSRRARKEEGKREKKKRIEEAGGKRPRSNHHDNNHKRRMKEKVHLKQRKSSSSQHHRFGRVMEQVPSFNQSRSSTVSIAIPGSVVSNAQTKELRTHLVGQIARAAAIYHIDEIIVYDDKLSKHLSTHHHKRGFYNNNHHSKRHRHNNNDKEDHDNKKLEGSSDSSSMKQKSSTTILEESTDPHEFMARVLQYCECPQYLRRYFFSMHPDLQYSGLLPPLDAPHHVRLYDKSKYREGIVLEKKGKQNGGSLVNCGIRDRPVE